MDRVLITCERYTDLPAHLSVAKQQKLGLELQEFSDPNELDGNWQGLLDQYQRTLDGFAETLPLHGSYIELVSVSPNKKWVADFTYVWTTEGWLYVAAVLDLYSRKVVGWSMSAQMTAQLVTDALLMAIWRRGKPDALLHHSDRGSPYTSEQFQRLMADHGVVCSMILSGNVWAKSAM